MNTVEKVALLRAAREHVEQGWTREYFERRGRVCVVGACNIAATGDARTAGPFGGQVREELFHQLFVENSTHRDLYAFNDAQKSKRPVLELIDRTIARLEAN